MTDVSNASRTMLMNIDTLKWDSLLCKFFGIPQHILPEIRSSAEVYGTVSNPQILAGIPITGVSIYMEYTDQLQVSCQIIF